MADYYHETRAHAKSLKQLSEDNKRRAERRAELASVQAEQPLNFLRIDGRTCQLVQNEAQYLALERMEGFIPWGGQQQQVLIDRFDGRALLDSTISMFNSSVKGTQKIDQVNQFESYRDLIRLQKLGMQEQDALEFVQRENIEIRAQARQAAQAAAAGQDDNVQQVNPVVVVSGRIDTDSDEDEEDQVDDVLSPDESREANKLGQQYEIDDFCRLLRKTQKAEQQDMLQPDSKPKRKVSRKKAAERMRRMGVQEEGGYQPHISGSGYDHGRELWRRTVPIDRRIMRDERSRRRSYSRSHSPSRSRSRVRSRSPRKARSRSTSRGRKRGRSHSRSRSKTQSPRHKLEYITEFKSSSKPSDHNADKSGRLRESERNNRTAPRSRNSKEADTQDSKLNSKGSGYAASSKETPAERLKRLMQVQLNRQVQKDQLNATQKQQAKLKEQEARRRLEMAAYSSSDDSYDSRSPSTSPTRNRSRSRGWRSRSGSRGRSRSPSRSRYRRQYETFYK